MLSVLRNNGALLSHTFFADGAATDADGAVTVAITSKLGTSSSGTATHDGTGTYTYTLAPSATLDVLTVTWSGTFSGIAQSQLGEVEIVGGFYCSIDELQNFADAALNDTTKYPVDVLAQVRREFEDLAETYCGVAFVPRFAQVAIVGTGDVSMLLPNRQIRTILAASATDPSGTVTPFTTTGWQVTPVGGVYTNGAALTRSQYGAANLTFSYEHGYDQPPPQIARACKLWVRSQLLSDKTGFGRDVLSETDGQGFSIRYSTPDWDAGRPTGIFDVDRALNSVGRTPVCA